MAALIRVVNDAITFEQTAFSKIHESSIELNPWVLRMDRRSQHSSSKSGNRQTNKPTTVTLLRMRRGLIKLIQSVVYTYGYNSMTHDIYAGPTVHHTVHRIVYTVTGS